MFDITAISKCESYVIVTTKYFVVGDVLMRSPSQSHSENEKTLRACSQGSTCLELDLASFTVSFQAPPPHQFASA